jgi:hypothetical protein
MRFNFLLLTAASGKPMSPDLHAPDFRDFQRRLASGEVNPAGYEGKLEYGLAHLKQALRNMQTERFGESLRLVAKTAYS